MELVYLPLLAVNNIGFLQHLLFGLVPVYVSVTLYFHQALEQKNTKQKSYAKSFKLCKFSTFGKRKNALACGSCIFTLSETLATSRVHGSRWPARKTIQ